MPLKSLHIWALGHISTWPAACGSHPGHCGSRSWCTLVTQPSDHKITSKCYELQAVTWLKGPLKRTRGRASTSRHTALSFTELSYPGHHLQSMERFLKNHSSCQDERQPLPPWAYSPLAWLGPELVSGYPGEEITVLSAAPARILFLSSFKFARSETIKQGN